LLLTLAINVTMPITGILSSAHATTPAERWEGYRSADSPEVQSLGLPFQGFMENAVLEMETVGVTRTAGERFEVVTVSNEPTVIDNDILSTDLRLMQIETCRKQDLELCPVLSYSNRGTVFFNRRRFVTCRHGFHNWLSLASQLNGNRSVRQISPPMILRDARGEVLYNSAHYMENATVQQPEEKPQMALSTINNDSRLNYQTYDTTVVAQSDYVEMTLSGDPILHDYAVSERTFADRNLRRDEETFLAGYPLRTDNFANGLGDAPGHKLVVSNGRANDPMSGFLQTSNYASPGMSGGAVLAANGELAGVHCRGNANTDPAVVRSFSLPIGRATAISQWSTIVYPSEAQPPLLDVTQSTSISQ
jgi:hypothetical protein